MLVYTLGKTLHEMGLSKNRIAVKSNTRPATIANYVSGEVERIETETLDNIIDALNQIAIDRGLERRFDISDIFQYKMGLIQQQLNIPELEDDIDTDR